MESALVLCEGSFGETMGKTANGLVRYSRRYRIAGVLDRTKAGRDAGEVLDGRRNGIPVFASLRDALAKLPERPTTMIVGVATFGGYIPTGRAGLLQGARYGVPLDSIKGDFMVGELEREVVRAFEENRPRVVVVEGQGSISHPAYVAGTRAIIMASMPSGIVLQHAPGRKTRNFRRDVVAWPLPTGEKGIAML